MIFLKKMKELPEPLADFIRVCGQFADEKKVRAYLVGGFVRDLFLGAANFDVDLVIEGDAIVFAKELSERLSLHVLTHKRFGTATLSGLSGFKADFASARSERYEKPAALPIVAPGLIQDDLARRDFTINAMAISINASEFGRVVDFCGGLDDLKKGVVRALHSLSFIDDPTRILRAVRFEQRFDFKIERETFRWIRQACRRRMLQIVQKHRLRDELVLLFKEPAPLRSLRRLSDLCGFSFVAPALRFRRSWLREFHETARKISWCRERLAHRRHIEPYAMYLALFFYALPLKEIKKAMLDFAFHKGESSRALSLKENFPKIDKDLKQAVVRPSTVFRLLEPLSYEVILLCDVLSRHPRVSRRIEEFLFVHNGSRPHTRGEDLKGLGVPPGPHFKKILEEIQFARIDGKVRDKEEELKLVEKLLREKEGK